MIPLRQSTASQEFLLGPFLDDTDGKTAEGSLTIANTDIKLWKAGATTEVNKNSGGGTHIAGGRYSAVLDATDTNTVGPMEVNVHVAGALPVRREFFVFTPAVYDALFATGAVITIGALAAQAKTDVKDQAVAALATDTYAELAAVPAATSTLASKLNWLFLLARNKILQTESTQTVRNDADSTTIATASVSDDDTTAIRGKFS